MALHKLGDSVMTKRADLYSAMAKLINERDRLRFLPAAHRGEQARHDSIAKVTEQINRLFNELRGD